jgi:hypothetical protein
MPMKPLNAYYSELSTIGAKLDHMFQVTITTNIPSVDAKLENLTLWAQSSEVPGRQQEFAPLSYGGYDFQYPTKMTSTQDISMTFNCDDLMKIRDALLFWKGTVADPDIDGGSVGGGNKKMSQAKIILDLYNDLGDTVTNRFELLGVYVADVGTIALASAGGAVATFDAAFKFQYFKNFSNN